MSTHGSALARLQLAISENPGALTVFRYLGAGFGFATTIVLAQLLGAEGLGLFYVATSLATILGVVAAQGYPQLAARIMARYRVRARPDLAGAFVSQAARDSLLASIGGALLVTGIAGLWPGLDGETRLALAFGGAMAVAVTMLGLFANIAAAMRLFATCYIPEGFLRPIAFLAVVAALFAAQAEPGPAAMVAVLGSVTGLVAAFVVRAVRKLVPSRPRHSFRTGRFWRREAWLLVPVALFTEFFADVGILVTTPFIPAADIAVLGICLKLSMLIGYVVQVAQHMAVPDLADARLTSNGEAIRAAVRRAIVLPAALTIACTLAAFAFGDRLLDVFGEEFGRGQTALTILILTQVVRALAGPAIHMMILRGDQRLNAFLCLAAKAVLMIAMALLTPHLGLVGAALAVLIAYLFWIALALARLRWLGEARVDVFALHRSTPAGPARQPRRPMGA